MKNIFLFLFALFITAFALDCFLKLTRITPPTLKYYDPVYGSLNRHNMQYLKSVEGFYIGNTNYDGRFRENYTMRKTDKQSIRIVLLGDSFVEGIDVFSKNHFAQYIEDILKKKLHKNVEVLNFGRGNCTVHAASYYFTNYIKKNYDADIVLVFTDGRDIYNIDKSYGYPSTCYKLDSNNQLAAADFWKNTSEYKLSQKLNANAILKYYDYSAYFRLLYRAMARIKISGFAGLTFGKFYSTKPHEPNYENRLNEDSLSVLTQKLYDTLAAYKKGQVVFVTRNKPVATPAIEAYFVAHKYKYIDVSDTFNNFNIKNTNINAYYFKATQTYGGHWNNDGHAAVGNYIANKIFDNIGSYNMPNCNK